MNALSPTEKWELKSLFYLSLLDRGIKGLYEHDPKFRRQAQLIGSSVRLVIHRQEFSRAWSFEENGLFQPTLEEPVGLTLQFESHRLFVKVIEEKTSPIAAILLGRIGVKGPLSQAYAFAKLLSRAGTMLALLKTNPREGQEMEATLAQLSLFYALFSVFAHFVKLRGLPFPLAPWTLFFTKESEGVTLIPYGDSLEVLQVSETALRSGSLWRFPAVANLKKALDTPSFFLKDLLFLRLRISGVGAGVSWVRSFIPFIKLVAPILTETPEPKAITQSSSA